MSLVSPQDRLTFLPTVEEIVTVGVAHLEAVRRRDLQLRPGLRGRAAAAGAAHRAGDTRHACAHGRGTININTNASNPRALQRLYDAGLDSLRASTISARRETYDAYYRPIGYTLDDVKRSLVLAREAGVYTSINLLCFPGLIDCEDEVEALLGFLRETGTRLVQLRNLNIDPELLWSRVPRPLARRWACAR